MSIFTGLLTWIYTTSYKIFRILKIISYERKTNEWDPLSPLDSLYNRLKLYQNLITHYPEPNHSMDRIILLLKEALYTPFAEQKLEEFCIKYNIPYAGDKNFIIPVLTTDMQKEFDEIFIEVKKQRDEKLILAFAEYVNSYEKWV